MPLNIPKDLTDSIKYCEHVGEYLQDVGRIGDRAI
jgi:hypothetical protein